MSDIIVPLPSSSSDIGLAPQHTPSGEPVTIGYKGKEYKGVTSTAVVTIPGTRITDISLPILAVRKQSPDSVGIHPKFDGIFGLAYSSLSKHHSPATAMDVLYTSDVIPSNEIGIQLCPYEMISDSFINIGNTDVTAKCGTNGRSVAWVQSPSDDYFTVNIKSILVNGKRVELPAGFQKKVEHGRTLYSVMETCFTYMQFPKVVVAALNNLQIENLYWKNHLMPEKYFSINWGKLPSLSIVMHAETPVTDDNYNSVVTIRLGPRDYIQRVDSKNFVFAIKAGPNDKATLGMSFMSRLGLTFDRAHTRIGFGAGCGCEVSTSKYPTILNSDQVLWPLPRVRLPKPTTSGSDGTFIRRRKSKTTRSSSRT
ncbi:hypothetical protein BDEG_25961 [Batrachochytrium dendrobatidis JEL423]|uniref:Peptidase A1 domain-containing protein n=1 Tax=Batrachochytrium dendrobatidis (strain JEL423) TaxID=403673 RepID=A0A177WSX4_BATDL|nr:hypothetical protein BDEG_25961 [Batrachochytrium dendrobatidis JEL423]